jgi:hypothetical protein
VVDVVNLARYVGDTVLRVSRLRYEVGDKVISGANEGSVEITFRGGGTLLCESAADGETVSVADAPWVDPFGGSLTEENADFVRTSGRWVRYDASDQQPFADLIGRQVVDVAPITGTTGKRYGVVVNVSGYLLSMYANADELHARLLA